jgi:hypothetical protein
MMHVIAGPDFYEGVRAVLIDKDRELSFLNGPGGMRQAASGRP